MRPVTLVAVVALSVGCSESKIGSDDDAAIVGSLLVDDDGDDADLQDLADVCSVGATNARTPAPRSQRFALEACDRLWALSDVGSSFERLGASCGGRSDVGDDAPFGDCVTRFANAPSNETANRSSRAVSQPSTTIVVEGSSGPAPNSDTDQSFMIDPADNSWIVVLASHMEATEGSRERAIADARKLGDEQGVSAAVLSTSRYPGLNPGFWVVYLATEYADEPAAEAACAELLATQQVTDCYARIVGEAIDS